MNNLQSSMAGSLQGGDLATPQSTTVNNPLNQKDMNQNTNNLETINGTQTSVPSVPSLPHLPEGEENIVSNDVNNDSHGIDNKENTHPVLLLLSSILDSSQTIEGMREVREDVHSSIYTETFSDKIPIENLPLIMRQIRETQDNPADEDKMTLSALTTFAGRMPNVKGMYDRAMLYPSLYLMISGPSGVAQKGSVEACRQLLKPISNVLNQKYEYQMEEYEKQFAEHEANKNKKTNPVLKPKQPVRQTVFVPANSSATSTYQQLSDNGGVGLIFETEADTLSQALSQDYGKYSDGLRKAFHHENINYSRRKDNEYVNIEEPKLSVLLTCTPMQIPILLPANNVENGLANRFLFYNKNSVKGWRSPWKEAGESLKDTMLAIGNRYYELYLELEKRSDNPFVFTFTHEQQEAFDKFFEPLYDEQIALHGETIEAFVVRMAVSAFRIAMILTVLRCYEEREDLDPKNSTLVCRNIDFQTTILIINCLINHTAFVYQNLLSHAERINPLLATMQSQEQQLFSALPNEFKTKELLEIAKTLGISRPTAERYLSNFQVKYVVVQRVKTGFYRKNNL